MNYAKSLLQSVGATNIIVHPDGKIDATLNGYRYEGLEIKDIQQEGWEELTNETIIKLPVVTLQKPV